METNFVPKELFDSLANVVETAKSTLMDLSAKVAAQQAVISALLENTSGQRSQPLAASIRANAEQFLAVYDDVPEGQLFRAAIAKQTEALLRKLPGE